MALHKPLEEEEALLPSSTNSSHSAYPPHSAALYQERSSSISQSLHRLELQTVILFTLSLAVIYLFLNGPKMNPLESQSRPHIYESPRPLDHHFANVGDQAIAAGMDPSFLTVPGGTRYPHPLPPAWPNPWVHRPQIADEWLSASRFPPLEGAPGVDADSDKVRKRRAEVGLGTKPLSSEKSWEVPQEYYNEAMQYSARQSDGWEAKGLNRGESFDENGRPRKVPRADIELGQSEGWKPTKLASRKAMPKVQYDFEGKSKLTEEESQRREWVRRAFLHLWESYKAHSWGHDEVRPLSGLSNDGFNGWGATIIDALDMLLILGLEGEYRLARSHVANVDFSYLPPDKPDRYPAPSPQALPPLSNFRAESSLRLPSELQSPRTVLVFETVIRYLGGLLSAYDLSGDPLMLERATELGDWLLPIFGTNSGLAVRLYEMGTNPAGKYVPIGCISEVASLTLEFTRLSQLTGDPIYFDAVSRSMEFLYRWPALPDERLGKLFPIFIDPSRPSMLHGTYRFGGQADSWIEYLVKEHQLLGGASQMYSVMYNEAMDTAHQYLIKPINVVPGMEDMVTIGDLHFKESQNNQIVSWFSMKLDHLTCFAGGMAGLGAKLLDRAHDFDVAKKFTAACTWAYDATRTGLSPETMQFWSESDPDRIEVVTMHDFTAEGSHVPSIKGDPIGVQSSNNYHIQRPETIESVWYMYRLTGDKKYQDKGWRMFTSWIEHTIVEKGFAHLVDVNSARPAHDDSGVESFVYAETLKYYYLLFSPPDLLSLDEYVLTTEAHPFRLPKGRNGNQKPAFWSGAPFQTPRKKRGDGTTVQKWARVMQAVASKEGA